MSSGSLVSDRIKRCAVGDGVRGSRDSRFCRCSSSYGMSMSTIVGVLSFLDSSSWVILVRQERPEVQMCTVAVSRRWHSQWNRVHVTFIECRKDRFHVRVHFGWGRFAKAKIACGYAAGARPRGERTGQRLSPHMLLVGTPVNVDHIARAMFHCLHLGSATRSSWSAPCRGASRAVGRKRSVVAK
jgi:hypothetical protein